MSDDFIRTSLKVKPLNKIQQTKPQESRSRKLENGIALKMARIVSKFKTKTIAYSTLQKSFAKIGLKFNTLARAKKPPFNQILFF